MRINEHPFLQLHLQYVLCSHGITEASFLDSIGDLDGKSTIYLQRKVPSSFDISKMGDLLSSAFRVHEIPIRLRVIDATIMDTALIIPKSAQQLINRSDSFSCTK